jgi:hypothetical protein
VNLQKVAATATATTALLVISRGVQLVDLTDKVVEDLLDVVLGLSRGLEEGAIEALGETLTLLSGDHTLVGQITLVTNQNHGDLLAILNTENLVAELGEVVEGGLGDDGVNQNETLTVLHVEITHSCELLLYTPAKMDAQGQNGNVSEKETFLQLEPTSRRRPTNAVMKLTGPSELIGMKMMTYSTGSIENLKHVLLVVNLDKLTIRILDGGVILQE